MRLVRLYHTIRHLKWRQIFGQLSRRVFSFRHDPSRWKRYLPPPFPGTEIKLSSSTLAPNVGRNSHPRILAGEFEFLNTPLNLGFPPTWIPPTSAGKLWHYNLHYFDWIHTLPFENAKQVTSNWFEANVPRKGAVSWDPYPTSLRCLNWALYFFLSHDEQTNLDPGFRSQIWANIARQMEYLSRNLETHLLGNHILENAATLAFLGTLFKGEIAQNWKRIGCRELSTQIPEQILPDGLHFEASPMYHLRVVYLLSLLQSIEGNDLKSLTTVPLASSVKALKDVLHPDGNIALLNDSAIGIYHDPKTLLRFAGSALAKHQNPEQTTHSPRHSNSWSLESAGYYGYRDDSGNYIICDAGPIGPDYIPGHAHADIFTYELSLKGCRVIVDTGNFDYLESPSRSLSRSTKAHNTVEIDGTDQCDMWGAFRVGQRVSPREVQFEHKPLGFRLSASHEGYNRHPSRAIHKRAFEVSHPFRIRVADEVSAPNPVSARTYIHLTPECSIIRFEEQEVTVQYPKGTFTIRFQGQGRLTMTTTNYFPEFGVALRRTTICYTTKNRHSVTSHTITPT
ncbi:heparinase II/III family protein [bacterium]|jgi:uncharacterized heparinase superfamily protein|nr:heparinase II/III family protein [bacterium]